MRRGKNKRREDRIVLEHDDQTEAVKGAGIGYYGRCAKFFAVTCNCCPSLTAFCAATMSAATFSATLRSLYCPNRGLRLLLRSECPRAASTLRRRGQLSTWSKSARIVRNPAPCSQVGTVLSIRRSRAHCSSPDDIDERCTSKEEERRRL